MNNIESILKQLDSGKQVWVKQVEKDKTSKILRVKTTYYLLTGYKSFSFDGLKFSARAMLIYNYEGKLYHYAFDTISTDSIHFEYNQDSPKITSVGSNTLCKLKSDAVHLITAKQILLNKQQHQYLLDMADCNQLL